MGTYPFHCLQYKRMTLAEDSTLHPPNVCFAPKVLAPSRRLIVTHVNHTTITTALTPPYSFSFTLMPETTINLSEHDLYSQARHCNEKAVHESERFQKGKQRSKRRYVW